MIEKPILSTQIKILTVKISSSETEELGSGIIYLPKLQEDKIFIITAKHCICGQEFSFTPESGDIKVEVFSEKKQDYLTYQLTLADQLLYFEGNQKDLAILIIDKNKFPISTKNIPFIQLVEDSIGIRNSAIFGFPNGSPNSALERVDTFLQLPSENFIWKAETQRNLQSEESDSTKTSVQGFSGSGFILNTLNEYFLFGIVTDFTEWNRLLGARIKLVNLLLKEHNYPAEPLHEIELDDKVKKEIDLRYRDYETNHKSIKEKNFLGNKKIILFISILLVIGSLIVLKSFGETIPLDQKLCIKPFKKDGNFKILILPFSKNGTDEKGDLGAEIKPMFEDVIIDYDLNLELHYLESVSVGLSMSKEMRDSLRQCNDADIIIYGSKWYSEDSGQGRITVKYDIDSSFPDIDELPFDGEMFKEQEKSPLGLIGKIENRFFTRELEDLQRIEQLIFWLSCLSERGKGNNAKANLLIEKALFYDSTNVNFSGLKVACLVNLNKSKEAESFMNDILQRNSNNELFLLLNIQLQCYLNNNENLNNGYSRLVKIAKSDDVLELGHHYFYYYKIFHENTEEVLKTIEEEIEKKPDSKAWKELKIVCISSNFKKGDTKGLEFIDDFLKKDSSDIGANAMMAISLCSDNQFDEANTYVDRAIELHRVEKVITTGGFRSLIRYDLSSLLNIKGIITLGLGDREEAIKYFDLAIELDSSKAIYWHHKGNLVGQISGDYKTALPFYKKAIQVDTNYNIIYFQLAQMYIAENELDSGKYYLNEYYSMGGIRNAETYLLEGQILAFSKKYRKVIDRCLTGLTYDSSNFYLYELIGSSYSPLGKLDSFQFYLEKALSHKKDYIDFRMFRDNKDSNELLQALYSSYSLSGDLLKAYYTNEKLIEKNPSNEEYFERKIVDLVNLGWHEEFLRLLDQELENSREDPSKFSPTFVLYLNTISLYLCHNTLKDEDYTSLSSKGLYLLAFRANMYACSGERKKALEDINLFNEKNKNEYPKATAFMFRALALLDSQSGNKNDALIEIDRGIKILEGENVKVEIPFNDSLKMLSPNILNPELIEFYLTRTQICLDGKDLTCAKKSIQIAKKLTPDYHRITKYELLIKMTEQTNI